MLLQAQQCYTEHQYMGEPHIHALVNLMGRPVLTLSKHTKQKYVRALLYCPGWVSQMSVSRQAARHHVEAGAIPIHFNDKDHFSGLVKMGRNKRQKTDRHAGKAIGNYGDPVDCTSP